MDTLPLPAQGPSTWTNIQGLAGLRRAAKQDSQAALPAVARQFESIFTQMLIKSMRDASFGGGILDSAQSDQWRDLFDHQIALSLAKDGRGMGIAAMLVRQLGGSQATPPESASAGSTTAPLEPAYNTTGSPAQGRGPDPTSKLSGARDDDSFLDRALHFAATTGRNVLHAARDWVFSGPADFVQKLAPYAQQAARELGVSVRAVLAQAALETGWGQHMPHQADGRSSHNLFGIKAGDNWHGQRANVPTLEFEHGVAVRRQAAFRAYPAPAQSFADYARLIGSSPRYAAALDRGEDIAGFADALGRAGYATDPGYAAKLTAIANSDVMRHALAELKNSTAKPTSSL